MCTASYVDQFCHQSTNFYPGNFYITWNKTKSGVTKEAPCDSPKLKGLILIYKVICKQAKQQ